MDGRYRAITAAKGCCVSTTTTMTISGGRAMLCRIRPMRTPATHRPPVLIGFGRPKASLTARGRSVGGSSFLTHAMPSPIDAKRRGAAKRRSRSLAC